MHGKSSFLLYTDLKEVLDELTDEQAGKLFKTILDYVNDKNPQPKGEIKLLFIPIRQNLKRDLEKYKELCKKNSDNGKLGGRPKKPNGYYKNRMDNKESDQNPNEPKKADNDNDIDTDIDNDTENDIDIGIEKQSQSSFKESTKENENPLSASNDTSMCESEKNKSLPKNQTEEQNTKETKEVKHKHGQYGRILLTDSQYINLCKKYSQKYLDEAIKRIDEYVEMNGNKNKYKDFNLVIQKAINQKWSLLNDITCQPEEQQDYVPQKDVSDEEAKEFFNNIQL